ncbi:MAG: Protein-L-isoaspartate O-methyltransferase, partial [uncultured Microvirga sp.]
PTTPSPTPPRKGQGSAASTRPLLPRSLLAPMIASLPTDRLDAILGRHAVLTATLNAGAEPEAFVALSRELSELDPVVEAIDAYRAAAGNLSGLDALLDDAGTDREMRALVDWLKAHNARVPDPNRQVGFYGLDLYGLGASIEMVADHLAKRDPAAADEARVRYACLSAYQDDPTDYAYDSLRPGFDTCEEEVGAALKLLEERLAPGADPVSFDALQNARAVVSGEKYYRTMSRGGPSSWNLRDQHMFDSLTTILDARGSGAKAVVWAHNSHVGNAAATEMSRRGEHNIGQLCRRRFGEEARLIGFGTDRGAVMAASRWGGDPQVKEVRPSLEGSYGRLLREAARDPFWLDLRPGIHDSLRQALKPERLERAIGVLYLPETERLSHYYDASLPEEFDAFLWFEETRAVTPVTDDDRTLPADHPLAP